MRNRNSRGRRHIITHSNRRGILLLVVLSMLTLFLLIGTAFIVSSDQYRQANKARAKLTETSNSSIDQQDLLDEVINQLVRDTNNINSAMRFHSLLRDMYGNDGFSASIDVVEWATAVPGDTANLTGGQILQFQVADVTDQFGNPINVNALSAQNNAYNGLVLTFLNGPARGQSTRIVSYLPESTVPGTSPVFRVMTPRLADGSTITDPTDLNGSRMAINGRPFNGTGAGYNPLSAANLPKLNTVELVAGTNRELALMPNAPFLDYEQIATTLTPGSFGAFFNNNWGSLDATVQQRLIQGLGLVGQGGADESYDAVDFQNMALALLQTTSVETVLPDLAATDPQSLGSMPIPSFHRPALLNYWRQQLVGGALQLQDEPNLLRKVLLRPNWLDHPNFTGSNPDFVNALANSREDALRRSIYGPWDVDNDLDGVRDSIWFDAGLPVMENADGRLVKPLVSVLVVDMDGRLNLNAHGSEDIANPVDLYDFTGATDLELAGFDTNPLHTTDILPQGVGHGPAEISLNPLMPYDSSGALTLRQQRWKWSRRMTRGVLRGASIVPNRNDVNVSVSTVLDARTDFLQDQFGKYGVGLDSNRRVIANSAPGIEGREIASILKSPDMPKWSNGALELAKGNFVLGGYATPPDPRGRYAVGLNQLGQPVYEGLYDGRNVNAQLDRDTPYELDLSLGAARGVSAQAPDGPYTVAELVRILRPYDADAGALPSRIWDFAGEFKNDPNDTTPNLDMLNLWRTTVTTDSYDLPVPSVVVPSWMRLGPDGVDNVQVNPTDFSDDFDEVVGVPIGWASFADLLRYRLHLALNPSNPANLPARQERNIRLIHLPKLLPPDLANGLRLDINRPLGNGRDDNDNGVVDEPGEWDDTADGNGTYDGEFEAPYWASTDAQIQNAGFTGPNGRFRDERILLEDRNNDSVVNNDDRALISVTGDITTGNIIVDTHEELISVHNQRRQMLARDLYVMALTLADPFDLTTREGKNKSRQLAQWAINVVDFRDPDNIMTAFEYDPNPFDGWQVDGNVATDADRNGADLTADTLDDAEVLWGAERPEVLMTESLAWHDRRTKDTGQEVVDITNGPADDKKGTVDSGDDQDHDQRQKPRGYGFIELYCPWPENPANNADVHAEDPTINTLGVDLARTHDDTPASRTPATGSPVWRMMVYKQGGIGKDPDELEIEKQPLDFGFKFRADRSIYFTPFDPANDTTAMARGSSTLPWDDNADGTAFFSSTTNVVDPLLPGTYMVVGAGEPEIGITEPGLPPGEPTGVPAGKYIAPFGQVVGFNEEIEPWKVGLRGIELDPVNDMVRMMDSGTTPMRDQAAFDMVASARIAIIDQVFSAGSSEQRRFSFSEPARGYPSPPSFFGNVYNPPRDVPLDDQRGPYKDPTIFIDPLKDGETRLSLAATKPGSNRTIPGFSWVYLQRLANPLLPWNPPVGETGHDTALAVNPYRTIDSIGVNVTVFNGLENDETFWPDGVDRTMIANLEKYSNFDPIRTFSSVQRGRSNDPEDPGTRLDEMQNSWQAQAPANYTAPAIETNLWTPEAVGVVGTNQPAGFWKNQAGISGNGSSTSSTGYNFQGVPDCTLGFLNEPFRRATPDVASMNPIAGSYNREEDQARTVPERPFQWLTWNNRPFANAGELMQVPAFRPSQLLRAVSFREQATDVEAYEGNAVEIEFTDPGTTEDKKLAITKDGPFGHMLNFFRSSAGPTSGNEGIVGLNRMLDYVHVSSPFVGSETWLNPAAFGSANVANANDPRYELQPPFNKVSSFREPGRVNLNTIVTAEVWEGGILHRELQSPGQLWDATINKYRIPDPAAGDPGHTGPQFLSDNSINRPGIVSSRRGYGENYDPMLSLNRSSPTFFNNPYRAADASDLVPIASMLLDRFGAQRRNVHATLLRNDGTSPRNGVTAPTLAAETESGFNSSNRNPYFRYQPISRMTSMTTNRSNVYAVWVTIGFFEAQEAPNQAQFANDNGLTPGSPEADALYDRVYPEGYMFGQEAGSDTGDIRRVREFAVIDRTIPVAFEPGENHNIDKAVRLRRRID